MAQLQATRSSWNPPQSVKIALGRSDGVLTTRISVEQFSQNLRDRDVFSLSDLGIIQGASGGWKEGVFSVLATSENLEKLDLHLRSLGLGGVTEHLAPIAMKLGLSYVYRKGGARRYSHRRLFNELAKLYDVAIPDYFS